MDVIDKAISLALKAHIGQTYGSEPYIYHLQATADEARALGCDDKIIAACYLHDILEDTPLLYNDVKSEVGEEIADIVYAVTDELGKNRKERKERTMPKIRGNVDATIVKLCDRIVNVKNARQYKHSMFKLYVKEHPGFLGDTLRGESRQNDTVLNAATELTKLFNPDTYEKWYSRNEQNINSELAETGATREMDFDPEREFEKRYEKYLEMFTP